jgi:hypothetical protein
MRSRSKGRQLECLRPDLPVLGLIFAVAIVLTLGFAVGVAPKPVQAAARAGVGGSASPALGSWVVVPPVTAQELRDVDMVSSNFGWAVGENGTVLKYDGVSWQLVDISTTQTLVDVYMLSATNGYIIAWGVSAGADIYHYDGTSWSHQYTAPGSLNRMDGSSPNNIWAVGLNLTVHWDGSSWSPVSIPVDRQLFGVIVPSASEAWAVGQYEPVSMHGLILHNTSGTWVQVASPASQTIFDGTKTKAPPYDAWAAGYNGSIESYVLRYDGSQWMRVLTNTWQLDRLSMLTASEGWAMSSVTRDIAHYDGVQWSLVPNPATSYIDSIYMVSPYDGWIVGGAGTTLHYVDTPPTATATATVSATPTRTATGAPGLTATATATATACAMPFTDVQSTDYFFVPVRYLYCRGVISGYADNTFRPFNNTTRGQLCKIVTLAKGWTIYLPSTPTFRDVPASDPFYQYIETAYHQGIISGYSCGVGCLEFRPGNNVTRGQLCKIIVLAQGWAIYTPPSPSFQDVQVTDAFYQFVETAYSHGIVSGYTCGTGCLEFRPGNNATRGQICKIVYNAVAGP